MCGCFIQQKKTPPHYVTMAWKKNSAVNQLIKCRMTVVVFFYPGGRGSVAPALGACCLGLAPSVVTDALLLLLPPPPPPPEALASPSAGEEEDDDAEVVLVVAPDAWDVNVEEAAATLPSGGLAAEEEAGACVEVGRC